MPRLRSRPILLLLALGLCAASLAACDDGGSGNPTADTAADDTASTSDTPAADASDTAEDATEPPVDADTTADDLGSDASDTSDTAGEDVVPAGCEATCEGGALPPGELLCDNEDPTQVCAVVGCDATGADDCNATPGDGCEQPLDAPETCGSCSNDCTALPNVAQASCDAGACGVVACAAGFEDCDGDPLNGCEVDTLSDPAHCGGCGLVCDLVNVDAHTCSSGVCGVATCDEGFGDCDSDATSGCETDIFWSDDGTHCGACGTTCSLPNATATRCGAGVCLVDACAQPYLEANADPVDGCEVQVVDVAQDVDIYANVDANYDVLARPPLVFNDSRNSPGAYHQFRRYRVAGSTGSYTNGIVAALPGPELRYTQANISTTETIKTLESSIARHGLHFVASTSSTLFAGLLPIVNATQSPGQKYSTAFLLSDLTNVLDPVATYALSTLPANSDLQMVYLALVESASTALLTVVAVKAGQDQTGLVDAEVACSNGGTLDAFTTCYGAYQPGNLTSANFISMTVVELERSPTLRALVILGHGPNVEADFFLVEVANATGAVSVEPLSLTQSDGSPLMIDTVLHTEGSGAKPTHALPSAADPTVEDGFVTIHRETQSTYRIERFQIVQDPMCGPHGICAVDRVLALPMTQPGHFILDVPPVPVGSDMVLLTDGPRLMLVNVDPASPYITPTGPSGVMTWADIGVGTTSDGTSSVAFDASLDRIHLFQDTTLLIKAFDLQGL